MIKNSPILKLILVFAIGVIFSALAIKITLDQPGWSENFAAGMTLSSEINKESIILHERDFLHEPGEIIEHAELDNFFDRQDKISKIERARLMVITENQQTRTMTSTEKKLRDLPILFWLQVFVGLSSLIISGWIWALRPRELANILFALSGFAMFMSAIPSAIYTTRTLSIPQSIFRVLENFNALGASLFGIVIFALFLVYPIRLPHWKKLVIAESVIFGAWTGAFLLKLIPPTLGISVTMVSEMLAICFAITAQYIFTKNNPKARAILTWLGLAVLLGAGAFILFNTIPLVFGLTPLNQGYAFSFFLIIYLGIAAGITRFRLFEVGQWAFRLLFYAAGALLLLVLDAVLIYVLGLHRLPALGLALLATGLVYLPLRDSIWSYFVTKGKLEHHEMLQVALQVAFAPTALERRKRWNELLVKLFNPLEFTEVTEEVNAVEIQDDGLTLVLPSVADVPALKLSFAWSGRALFTSQSKELAIQITNLIKEAETSRTAYDRGVAEERRRMAQDLHDDVGARLLSGLYIADEKLKPTLQGALSDIRSIVSGMTGEKISLERLLADQRYETQKRLANASVQLVWPVETEFSQNISQILLDYRFHKAISSAMREAISNVIKHANATRLEVSIQLINNFLEMTINDNGVGFVQNIENAGFGLKSIKKRMSDINGSYEVESQNGLTSVKFKIPLK